MFLLLTRPILLPLTQLIPLHTRPTSLLSLQATLPSPRILLVPDIRFLRDLATRRILPMATLALRTPLRALDPSPLATLTVITTRMTTSPASDRGH